MNRAFKWKLIAGFVLVFLAGGMTGAFVTMSCARHFFFGPHHHAFLAQTMRNRLRIQLHLTDEQLTRISPIIDKTATQLEEIRMNTGKRVRETIAQAHREMVPNLTPEQRAKLQEIEARHRRWLHRARGPREPTPEPSLSAQ
jgi:Spy/CpxP family protein refolding chaperone